MRRLPADGLLWGDFFYRFYRELRAFRAMSASIRVSANMGFMRRMSDSALMRKLYYPRFRLCRDIACRRSLGAYAV